MFSLMSGLWKYMFQKEEYFVLILGIDNAGKTVIIIIYCYQLTYIPYRYINIIIIRNISFIFYPCYLDFKLRLSKSKVQH